MHLPHVYVAWHRHVLLEGNTSGLGWIMSLHEQSEPCDIAVVLNGPHVVQMEERTLPEARQRARV